MKFRPTDGAMVLARWRHEGVTKSPQMMGNKLATLPETETIGMTVGVTRKPEKPKAKISHETERKRQEKALDEAIENTFPASDPVSAEQPV